MKQSTTDHTTRDKSRWFFWAAVGLCVLSVLVLTAALVSQHNQRQQLYQSQSPMKPFKPGQTVRMGAVSVTVANPSYTNGSSSFAAPPDKHYLIVDFTVKNFSDKPITVLPSTDTYVKDTAGNVVNLTPYGLDRPFHGGELPAGEQVSGQLSYLVPRSRDVTLYVDGIWSGGVLPFALK
jgi:hypothetical protein